MVRGGVVVFGGRQPACILRLAPRHFSSPPFYRFSSASTIDGAFPSYGYAPVPFAGIYSMAQRKRTVQQAFLVKFATQTEEVLCGLFPQRTS